MPPRTVWSVDQIPEIEQSKQVQCLRVTIHSIGPLVPGGQLSQNHWTVELVLETGSIRLDMTHFDPSSTTDYRGSLKVSPLPYQLSEEHVNYFDYATVGVCEVGHFTNVILEKGRHRYNMTDTGVGSRHWVSVVFDDWKKAGLIGDKTTQGLNLNDYLSWNWSIGQAPIQLEIKKGSFY